MVRVEGEGGREGGREGGQLSLPVIWFSVNDTLEEEDEEEEEDGGGW